MVAIKKQTVVVDGSTSHGPSTALPFAYELVHQLGGDADQWQSSILFKDVLKVKNSSIFR